MIRVRRCLHCLFRATCGWLCPCGSTGLTCCCICMLSQALVSSHQKYSGSRSPHLGHLQVVAPHLGSKQPAAPCLASQQPAVQHLVPIRRQQAASGLQQHQRQHLVAGLLVLAHNSRLAVVALEALVAQLAVAALGSLGRRV